MSKVSAAEIVGQKSKPIVGKYLSALRNVSLGFLALTAMLGAIHFPRDVDAPLTFEEVESAKRYYADAYKKPAPNQAPSEQETKYLRTAEAQAGHFRIEDQVSAFARQFNLHDKSVLEIGSGRGYLQDIVPDYTGLDISSSVSRFYHKKFVLGSATAMPFTDNSFDAVWSVWVFEHVPNPEQAFREARRVTKNGGVIFLYPAWLANSWAAQGYAVRPYSDFDLSGKLIKASVPLRASVGFRFLSIMPVRVIRAITGLFGPTQLLYNRLEPNYEQYWVEDADAVNSIDSHEALLWFLTRGDECLNCEGASLLMNLGPLIIRVNKADRSV